MCSGKRTAERVSRRVGAKIQSREAAILLELGKLSTLSCVQTRRGLPVSGQVVWR